MARPILLGYVNGVSKNKGNEYWRVDLGYQTTPAENSNGRFGVSVQSCFVDKSVFDTLTQDMVLKEVDIQSCGFGYHQEIAAIRLAK